MPTTSFDIGYFSSADRGLDCLVSMLPRIEEKLGRKVKTVWAYGWDVFDQVHKHNPERMRWKWRLIRDMHTTGVESKGRLSHEELAKLMKDTKVFAYPTEFTEIYCITVVKAQEAGMVPVTTNVGALQETAVSGFQVKAGDIYTNTVAQEEFIEAVVTALKGDKGKLGEVPGRYWQDVVKEWDTVCA